MTERLRTVQGRHKRRLLNVKLINTAHHRSPARYCVSCFAFPVCCAHHLAGFCGRRQVTQGGPGGCGSGVSRPPRVDCPYSTCAHNIDAPEGRPAEVFPARGGASAEHPEAVHAPRARRQVVSQVCVRLCVCMHV